MDRNSQSNIIKLIPGASLSARRAWIEIRPALFGHGVFVSLSARRAWIEIVDVNGVQGYRTSLSARRAWIEIQRK